MFQHSRWNLPAALVATAALLLPISMIGVLRASADPASPITVSNIDSADPVASGAELTYTVVMTNSGGSKVDSLVLTDQLNGVGGIGVPPQLVLTSSQGSCSQSALKVTCLGGTLGGGKSWTVTMRGIVTAPSGATLNNTASVTGTKTAQNFTTTATATTLVSGGGGGGGTLPDLTISKTGPASVVVGASYAYTLTVNNLGTANTSNVRVVDTLPAGVDLVSVATTSLFVCAPAVATASPVTVTCDGGAVNQGSNATITLNVTAPLTAGSVGNTAAVDPNNAIAESNELNNTSATVATTVTSGPAIQGLTITNSDAPDPIVPGAQLTYTIVTKNVATTRADDVVTVDGTQGLEAASVTASQVIVNGTVGVGGGCVVTASQVRCNIRSLNPGGTQTVTIKGLVSASAGSSIFNTATATGNIKNQGTSASASQTTTIRPAVDLTITKSGSPDPVRARSWPGEADVYGNGLVYTFVVGNSGLNAAPNSVVRDPLPAGLIYDSFTNGPSSLGPVSDFACAIDVANVLTCTNPSIAGASTESFSIKLVAPPTLGVITNTITVDPNNAIYEADETNNTATTTTTVITGIDLVINKTDAFDPIATSGTQTYTITVDDIGPQNASGIKLRDKLPAGTTFLSAIPDATHGFTCSYAGPPAHEVTCIGGHLLGSAAEFYPPLGAPGNDTATVTIKVFARPTVGTMHNEVRVDPDNEIDEAIETNNLAVQDTAVTNGGAPKSAYNELTILKTQLSPVPPTAVATNGTLTYNLLIGNDATDPAQNIVVKDTLPTGSRFIEAADLTGGSNAFTCSYAVGVVTCTGASLSGTVNAIAGVPTSRNISIKVFAPNTPATYTNQAEVDPGNAIAEGDEFNNISAVTTKVEVGGANMFNELTIKKTQATANPVATSSSVIYNVEVANTGSDPAFDVKVVDTLPSGFTYVEARDLAAPGDPQAFNCAHAATVITCTGATIGAGATRTLVITALTSAVPGSYTNQALVDPNNTIPEGNETNNAAQATTTVNVGAGNIDLQISKSGPPAPVEPGEEITYTIAASNAGTNVAFNVTVQDVLPAGTTFVSAADATPGTAGSFTCSYVLGALGSGGTVTCTNGTLDGSLGQGGGAPTSRNIIVKVTAPLNIITLQNRNNVRAILTNQAVIDPSNSIAESNETNNSSNAVTTMVRSKINLKLTKTGPTTASQNSESDYVITVTNEDLDGGGGATAFGVKIVDPLPVGLIPLAVSADPGNFSCAVTENPVNTVTCVGDLVAASSVTITVHVFVTANGGTLDNEACVDPNGTITEQNEQDNCQHAISTVVPPQPDLLINKSADSGTVSPGQPLTYSLIVSNIGDGTATGPIAIHDTIPSSVTLVNTTGTNGFTCTGDPAITCTGGDLAPGEFATITILTTVKTTGLPASFVNTATVDVISGESVIANNTDSITTAVGGSGIDLQLVSITDSPDSVSTSGSLVYTIVATNNGTSPANGAAVRINLPPTGVTHVGSTGTNGFNCTLALAVVTCIGDFTPGGSTIITVSLTVQAGAPPDLTLMATVDPTNAFIETNEGNNTDTEVTTVSNSTCTSSPCIDLVLTQLTGGPQPVKVGNDATFTFVMTNIGDTPVLPGIAKVRFGVLGNFGAAILGPLPAGWSCVDPPPHNVAGDHEWICTDSNTLLAGAGATFTLTATAIAGPNPQQITGVAQVDPDNAVAEFIETNNGAAMFSVPVIP